MGRIRLALRRSGPESVDPLKPTAGPKDEGSSVNVIVAAFLTHAVTYYVKNGKQTAEVDCIKSAMTPLVALYGYTPAKELGPWD